MASAKQLFVLGTSSKYRLGALRAHLGQRFALAACEPDIDEKAIRRDDPAEMVEAIARGKMEAVLQKIPADPELRSKAKYVFTSDQVALFEGCVREKPNSEEENVAFLKGYRNSFVETVAATVVHDMEKKVTVCGINKTKTCFGDLSDELITAIVQKGDSMVTCGGFTVEAMMPCVVSMEGTVEEVQGTSIAVLDQLLTQLSEC